MIYMTDEQRAHDFAIEIMKMYFSLNDDNIEVGSDGKRSVPTDELFKVYEAAYKFATEN